MKPEKIALFDMDGTLCDYDKAMQRDLKKIITPGEVIPTNLHEARQKYWRNRVDIIRVQPGWWAKLPKFKLGFQILKIAQNCGFQIHILTKGPSSKPNAWREKVEWIRMQRELDDAKITITEDKGLVYGRILVDDFPPYVMRWLEWRPRGLVIMPAQPWNEGMAASPNIMRYDGSRPMRQKIKTAIEKAYRR
jgi:FMN phosphatase YigB (HAD superfamily)